MGNRFKSLNIQCPRVQSFFQYFAAAKESQTKYKNMRRESAGCFRQEAAMEKGILSGWALFKQLRAWCSLPIFLSHKAAIPLMPFNSWVFLPAATMWDFIKTTSLSFTVNTVWNSSG